MHSQAQLLLATQNLNEDLAFFDKLGFRLDNIYPADEPAVAVISGHGLQIRLDTKATEADNTIYILTDESAIIGDGASELTAPNGTKIKLLPRSYQLQTPVTRHKFEVRRLEDEAPWVIGRAGMLYRDLIPDRLGGSIIASHIRIPNGGPVPDMVHYHTIGFQLIFCIRGWVKLVYEDQGAAFILEAGDCVTQPPKIRHRVLEASDNLEVIEIGVPAEHMTTIEHEMELPTPHFRPDREFEGQTFCHHRLKTAIWSPWRIPDFEHRNTGVDKATKGMASVQVARPLKAGVQALGLSHQTDILFTFVNKGNMELLAEGQPKSALRKGDAFVIPPGMQYGFAACSKDLELLEVAI